MEALLFIAQKHFFNASLRRRPPMYIRIVELIFAVQLGCGGSMIVLKSSENMGAF